MPFVEEIKSSKSSGFKRIVVNGLWFTVAGWFSLADGLGICTGYQFLKWEERKWWTELLTITLFVLKTSSRMSQTHNGWVICVTLHNRKTHSGAYVPKMLVRGPISLEKSILGGYKTLKWKHVRPRRPFSKDLFILESISRCFKRHRSADSNHILIIKYFIYIYQSNCSFATTQQLQET